MANEQEIAKLVIRLVADIKGLKQQFAEVQKDTKTLADQTQKHASTFASSIAGVQAAYVGMAAAVYASYKIIQGAVALLDIGAKAKQTEESFAMMTKSLGVNGDEMIRRMKEVGVVFFEQTGLMIKAQRLLIEGVSPEDVVGLMEAARVASRLMGIDVEAAFERVSEAVITLRTRGLKAAFPMDLAEVTERHANSLGTVTKYLNEVGQRQAIINELTRQKIEKKSFLGAVMDEPSVAEDLQKVKSALSELKEEFSKVLVEATSASNALPIFMDIVKALSEGIKELKNFKGEFGILFGSIELGLRTILIGVKGFFTGVTAIFFGVMEINYELLSLFNFITVGAIPGLSKAVEDFGARKQKVLDSLIRQAEDLNKVIMGKEEAKTPEAKKAVVGMGEVAKKDQIDQEKLKDDLTKFRLANEEQRIAAQNEIVKSGLEKQRAMQIEEARRTGQDVTLIEIEWDRRMAQEELKATQANLDTKRKSELEQARRDGMDREVVKEKFRTLGLAAEAKYSAEVAKIDAKAADYARQLWAERETKMADFSKQLAEISGDYDAITSAQARGLEVERQVFLLSDQAAKLTKDQLITYNNLMDKRIEKLKQVRELESLKETAEFRKQIGELTGDWVLMKDAEIASLEAERQITITTKGLTEAQRELINVIYEKRDAELQAQKDMNVGALIEIGARKEAINLNQQLADSFQNLIPNALNAGAGAVKGFLKNLADGTMSAKEAFKQLAKDFGTSIMDMIIDVGILILKMEILKALGYGTGAGATAGGGSLGGMGGGGGILGTVVSLLGSLIGFQTGGFIRGPSGADVIPIRGTAGEYMQPVPAVRYYGLQAMEAIRSRAIPRERFLDLLSGVIPPRRAQPSYALAAGGPVPSEYSPMEKGKVELTFINVSDPRDIDRYLSSAAGQNAVLNVLSSRAETVKKIMR
jgi:hypothetical protein